MTKALHAILGKEKSQPQIVSKELRGLQEENKYAKPQDLLHWLPYIKVILQYIYLTYLVLCKQTIAYLTQWSLVMKLIHPREERQNLEDVCGQQSH